MIKVTNVLSLYSGLYQVIEYCKENKNEEIDIIVPDKLSLFMEKFLFEKMNISATFNIRMHTLNRFAKKNCDIDSDNVLSKTASILLIHRILNDNIEKLEILNSKAYSFSYAENIFMTISQLKSSKITYNEMLKFSSKEEQLYKKIKDLAFVYEEYEKSKAGLLDATDVFLVSVFNTKS